MASLVSITKIETRSIVSLKFTSRINLRRRRTYARQAPAVDTAHKPPAYKTHLAPPKSPSPCPIDARNTLRAPCSRHPPPKHANNARRCHMDATCTCIHVCPIHDQPKRPTERTQEISTLRSSHSPIFFKIIVLKSFAIFTGMHLCLRLF